jgi:integrase
MEVLKAIDSEQSAGLRLGELIRLKVRDIHIEMGIIELAVTLKDDTTNRKRTVKRQTKCQPFAK